jgi:hypothetical protein
MNDPEESDREIRPPRQKSPFFLVDSQSQKIITKAKDLDETANSEKLIKPQNDPLKKILRPSSASTSNLGVRNMSIQEKTLDAKKTVFSILDP